MTAPAFDLHRLYNEINAERQRQDLSWTALSRQVHVAASTIRRYAHADDAEADGVLTLIQWLDAAPEDYITNNAITPTRLPPAERGQVRIDMTASPKPPEIPAARTEELAPRSNDSSRPHGMRTRASHRSRELQTSRWRDPKPASPTGTSVVGWN